MMKESDKEKDKLEQQQEPVKFTLARVPDPEVEGEEALRLFCQAFCDHMRKLAGLPPLYSQADDTADEEEDTETLHNKNEKT